MSSLILATGSNIGDRYYNLQCAQDLLSQYFIFETASQIYHSEPVDYLAQPEFYNQVLQFKLPIISAKEILQITQDVESKLGGHLGIPKGPRHLDVDILFIGREVVNLDNLTVPHPEIKKRSFVLLPLSELPFYKEVSKEFPIPIHFNSWAKPIDPTL